MVAYELAVEVGEDGRAAGETCPVLLVALCGESSDAAVVCQHVGADSGAAGSYGIARAGAIGKSIPRSGDGAVPEKTEGTGNHYRGSGLAGPAEPPAEKKARWEGSVGD